MGGKEKTPHDLFGEFVAPPKKNIKNVPSDIYGEFAVSIGRKGSQGSKLGKREEHREGRIRARERRRKLPIEFFTM